MGDWTTLILVHRWGRNLKKGKWVCVSSSDDESTFAKNGCFQDSSDLTDRSDRVVITIFRGDYLVWLYTCVLVLVFCLKNLKTSEKRDMEETDRRE